jgi:hypothetical protein
LENAARARQNPEAPMALAQVYLALREPRKAVEAARQAVAADPTSLAARELLIAALAKTGDNEGLLEEQRRRQERK